MVGRLTFLLIYLLPPNTYIVNSSLSDGLISRRIVKGFKVNIEQFPHAVFLYFNVRRPSTCGSSLITESVIISSAHCLQELHVHKGGIHAYLGAAIPIYAKAVRNISEIRIHPRYSAAKGKFDLGMAKFNHPVIMCKGIHTIPIAINGPRINESLFTAGWGKHWPNVMPDYSDTRHLKVSKQRILSIHECLRNTGIRISPPYLCTVPINGFHYRGDMGNGLVIIVQSRMTLVGVVSFMVKDATLYASISKERDWIKKHIRLL